jgi:hypothetical protein
MYHVDKDAKTYGVKVKKYDSGTPENFLKWCLILNEQTKTNGYDGKYDMIMSLAQAMMAGSSMEAFFDGKMLTRINTQNPQGQGADAT